MRGRMAARSPVDKVLPPAAVRRPVPAFEFYLKVGIEVSYE